MKTRIIECLYEIEASRMNGEMHCQDMIVASCSSRSIIVMHELSSREHSVVLFREPCDEKATTLEMPFRISRTKHAPAQGFRVILTDAPMGTCLESSF